MSEPYFVARNFRDGQTGAGWCIRRAMPGGASEPVLEVVGGKSSFQEAVLARLAEHLNRMVDEGLAEQQAQALAAALEEQLSEEQFAELAEDLDEMVHEGKGEEAAEIDNAGLDQQIAYLGPEAVVAHVAEHYGVRVPLAPGMEQFAPSGGQELER